MLRMMASATIPYIWLCFTGSLAPACNHSYHKGKTLRSDLAEKSNNHQDLFSPCRIN